MPFAKGEAAAGRTERCSSTAERDFFGSVGHGVPTKESMYEEDLPQVGLAWQSARNPMATP